MLTRCAMAAALALSACTPMPPQVTHAPQPAPRASAVALPEGLIADQVRLFQVSYPLLRAARDLCAKSTTHGMGLFALNRHAMGNLSNAAWRYGIGDELKVLAAIPDGPAYKAGLTAGDVLLAINSEQAPATAAATRAFSLKMAQLSRSGAPLRVAARRGDETVMATVQPETLCGYQVRVAELGQVNARADGRGSIYITRGMLHFARTDPELALVVAHEIAHNAMGHQAAKAQLMRSLAATGTRPPGASVNGMTPAVSQGIEMEADRLGLYIVARAGMDIEGAPEFLERLAADPQTSAASQAQTHPSSSARIAAVRKTIAEIEGKRAASMPLVP
jgi:Putative Zn-dependent protease, contains TPR repeats